MIKSFLMLSTFLGSFVFGFFFVEGVEVVTKQQASVNPGDEYTCEIVIDKPGLMGFAKIQQQLPEGFTAEPIETQSASFSSVAGKVKFIWMSLPSDDQFTISYKVKVGADVAPGDYQIDGRFSFLVDNIKDSKDLETTMLKVNGVALADNNPAEVATDNATADNSSADNTTADNTTSNDTGNDTPVANNTTSSTDNTSADASSDSSPTAASNATEVNLSPGVSGDGKVTVKRSITPMEDGKYKITYDITNNGLEGFAKLQDVLPGEMMAYEEDPKDAVYSFTNRKSKFVWMSFPEEKQFQVSYLAVTKDAAELEGITGEFSYLDDNETKRFAINTKPANDATSNSDNQTASASDNNSDSNPTAVAMGATPNEDNSTSDASSTTNNTQPTQSTDPNDNAEQSSTKTLSNNQPTASNTSSNAQQGIGDIATNNTGVGYKVQIMANKRNLKNVPVFFKKTYSYNETKVSIENHQGWIKYTVNNYDNYKSARDRRNQVTAAYNFPGPFVTAYNDGKRITVQEALMISREKWVP